MVYDIVLPTLIILIIVTWWLPKVIKVIIKYHQIIGSIREAVPPPFLMIWVKGEGLVDWLITEDAGLIPWKANFIGNMIINGKTDRSVWKWGIYMHVSSFFSFSWSFHGERKLWTFGVSLIFRQTKKSQVAVFFHSALAVWVFGDAQMTGTKNFFFDTSEASSYVAEASKILGNQAERADIEGFMRPIFFLRPLSKCRNH